MIAEFPQRLLILYLGDSGLQTIHEPCLIGIIGSWNAFR
jgi:hypothetical protein